MPCDDRGEYEGREIGRADTIAEAVEMVKSDGYVLHDVPLSRYEVIETDYGSEVQIYVVPY
jgi:reverse gyrase